MAMREILFRGKRIDNGEWVKGYYSYETDERSFELHLISDNKSVVTEVVPETVGQYTGMKDKNGKKIFEGDIVRVLLDRHIDGVMDIGRVFYSGVVYGFLRTSKRYSDVIGRNTPSISYNEECEIIGNIHDNPELLEGGEQNGN